MAFVLNYFKILTVNKIAYLFLSIENSIPSRNPKVANISPGFHSDTVEIRPEGTRDDFTATDPNDYKPSANTPSHGTQNEIASHKGLFILCEL